MEIGGGNTRDGTGRPRLITNWRPAGICKHLDIIIKGFDLINNLYEVMSWIYEAYTRNKPNYRYSRAYYCTFVFK